MRKSPVHARVGTHPEAGAALLTAIVILLALTIMGFALVLVTKVDLSVSRNMRLAQEAVFAAEQGALAGIQEATDNTYLDTAFGDTLPMLSSSKIEAAVRYPQWQAQITKEGYAPKGKDSSIAQAGEQVNYYQFRIESKGFSRAQVQRTVEILIRKMQIEHSGGEGASRIAHRYGT